jgi:hypothetical protein
MNTGKRCMHKISVQWCFLQKDAQHNTEPINSWNETQLVLRYILVWAQSTKQNFCPTITQISCVCSPNLLITLFWLTLKLTLSLVIVLTKVNFDFEHMMEWLYGASLLLLWSPQPTNKYRLFHMCPDKKVTPFFLLADTINLKVMQVSR